MANAKKGAKVIAPKKRARSKSATVSKPSKQSWQEQLLALPLSFENKIDRPVGDVLFEASNLRKTASKEWAALEKKSTLPSDALSQLKHLASHLENAEDLWSNLRKRRTPGTLAKAREKGRELRADTLAALRYFLRGDTEVQARVESIVEGDGDADLIDDLRKLAGLVDEHRGALAKADLPKASSDAYRKCAETLTEETSERASDVDAAKALALRNRAYWSLRGWMSEVRAAGRYVFRKDPLTAARFVDGLSSKRAPKAEPSAPVADKAKK